MVETYVGLSNALYYLRPGGKIRIAVPDYDAMRVHLDGFVGDKEEYLYQKDLAEGHKVRYSRESLSILLAKAGYHRVEIVEYCTRGQIVMREGWGEDDEGGRIKRSSRGGEPVSLVVDAYKHEMTAGDL